jgi:phosphatidylglycerophosphatase A
LNFPTRLITTGFFSGYSQFAPGTAGSAVAMVIYLLLPEMSMLSWGVLLAFLFLLAVPAAYAGEALWGKDPGPVVIDEIVGYFVTVAFLPFSVGLAVAGFFIFRVLDILKPPPARQSESLPGGWGVVVDDVVAGIYGNLILRGVLVVWNG